VIPARGERLVGPSWRWASGWLSLRRQVLLIIVAATTVAWGILLAASLNELRLAEDWARTDLTRLGRALAARHEQQLASIRDMLELLALSESVRDGDPARCDDLLTRVVASKPEYLGLARLGADGTVLCAAAWGVRESPATQPWFQAALARGTFVVGPVELTPGGDRCLPMVLPLGTSERSPAGALVIWVTTAALEPPEEVLELLSRATVLILDPTGTVAYRYPDPARYVGQNVRDHALAERALASASSSFEATGLDGVRRLYAVTPLRWTNGAVLVLGKPFEQVYAPATSGFQRDLAFLAPATVIAVTLLWRGIGYFISDPLARLIAATRRIAAGDFAAARATGYPANEIGELARTLEWMACQLAQREQQIRHQLAELLRANAELERLASVAAHDLQEPLRSIAGFSQLLSRRYRGRLDSDADEFLDYIQSAVERMSRLINDLLLYSRLVGTPLALEVVASGEALDQALANLRQQIIQTGATIQSAPLPSVRANRSQLVQVFQNLISNALKYRSAAPPAVTISAQRAGRWWEFRVSDNGIGIAPEYHQRIFELFQRLHGQNEYDGTGLGLAVVKGIVERHGGQVWVESRLGAGATFCFTLPAVEEQE
jgi:signal transduction histidine kinase